MNRDCPRTALLLRMLEGSRYVNARRSNGTFGRMALPDEMAARTALVKAHLNGDSGTLTFESQGRTSWRETVDAVVLAAFCPREDGHCGWLGIDLDAADHGETGLADVPHAVRVFAERADNAGLSDGLVVARSKGAQGRHVFLILPRPVPLKDAVLGLAALSAHAFLVATADASGNIPHAFADCTGSPAELGKPGFVEFFPRSVRRPPYGWALTLPMAGAFAHVGGGQVVDPFEDVPTEFHSAPACHAIAWDTLIRESRDELRPAQSKPRLRYVPPHSARRISDRTEAFIQGRVAEGGRNNAAFAACANLLEAGMDEREVWRLIQQGAASCGLPEREAKSAFDSARRRVTQMARWPR